MVGEATEAYLGTRSETGEVKPVEAAEAVVGDQLQEKKAHAGGGLGQNIQLIIVRQVSQCRRPLAVRLMEARSTTRNRPAC